MFAEALDTSLGSNAEVLWKKNLPANIRLGEDVLKKSSKRLQDIFRVTFFCLPCLQDVFLKTVSSL